MNSKLTKCLYLYLAQTEHYGLGLYTARDIRAGERIIVDDDGDYYERTFSYQSLCAHGYDLHDDAVQIGADRFVIPNDNLDDYMNHSCEPNCGVCLIPEGYYVVTLREIARDEQVTYDYSTQMSFDHPALPCRCGAASCRGDIGNFETLPVKLQNHYINLGVVADHAVSGRQMTES